jgi:hypothetical protein
MTRTLLVVSLLLSACASTAPTRYEQAAPAYVPAGPPPVATPGFFPGTPAEPVYTPNGAGLPGERPPLPQPRALPTSPNKRVLPDEFSPKREAGLWAADGAPVASVDRMPPIFGVPHVYPENVSPSARKWSDFCATSLDETAKQTGADATFSGVHPQLQRCLAARAYLACAFALSEHGGTNAPDPRTVREMQSHAKALVAYNCREGQADPENEPPYRAMIDQWRKDLPGRLTPVPRP